MATTEQERAAAAIRVPVQGRPGIWCRKTPNGRVRFEISYEDAAGGTRWITVAGGLAGAEAALAALERRLSPALGSPDLTFQTVAERWLEGATLSGRVRQAYEWALHVHLFPRVGHLRVSEVGEWHAIGLLDDLRSSGYADWTVHAVLGPLGVVMRYAAMEGLIPANPFEEILADGVAGGEPAGSAAAGAPVVSLRHFRATLTRR
jgi:hypothetical protein